MKTQINDLSCKKCGRDLNFCEGDALQIIQECQDSLETECPICGEIQQVEIDKLDIEIKVMV